MTPPTGNLASLVDDMLEDAGCGDDHKLRETLFSLGALASFPAPAPSGELAALLAPAGTPAVGDAVEHAPAQEEPDDDLARRRRRHRPTALGLVLVAGMGLGVGGVAASTSAPGSEAVQQLLADWTPPWSAQSTASASDAVIGYRSPALAADEEVPGPVSGSPAADPHGGSRAARLLEDTAGVAGRGGWRSCGGPSTHDDRSGPGACVPGPLGAAFPAAPGGTTDSEGRSRNDAGVRAAADGAPPGAPAAGKAEAAGTSAPATGQDIPGTAAPKQTGAPGAAGQATGQTTGQGSGRKPESPAK